MAMPVLAAGHTQWHLQRYQRAQGYVVMMPAMQAGHYHWHVGKIQRSQGHSICAAASYITGGNIKDSRTRRRHNYSDRFGVTGFEITLPQGAPREYLDLSVLCNAAEAAEKLPKAVIGRNIDFGLPHQLSPQGDRRAGLRMVQALVNRYGAAAIIAWHAPSHLEGHDQRNRHCHIILTSRRLGPDGFGEKTRELDDFLQGPAEIEWMRREWMRIANEELEREGINVRINCHSLKDQGITDRVPQIHEGVKVRAMLDRGVNPAEIQKLHGRPASTEANKDSNWLKKRIPYELLDQGLNRHEFNGNLIALNDHSSSFGPLPLEEQIHQITVHLPELISRVTDLEALLPRGLLPVWAQVRLEWGWYRMKALLARFIQEKEEERERLEEENRLRERKGIHAQIRMLKDKIERLETMKRQLQAAQRLFMRIEATMVMRPSISADTRPPPRIISHKQFSVEMHFKAETARAKVPPEYRPRIERPAPAGQGSRRLEPRAEFTAAVKGPPDNGGLAKRPPALRGNFNAQADPAQPAYRSQVKIAFGPKRA